MNIMFCCLYALCFVVCRYKINIEQIESQGIDKSLTLEWSSECPPTYLKNEIWQIIIEHDLFEAAMQYLHTNCGKTDNQIIRYILHNDFKCQIFKHIDCTNVISLPSEILDYILTYTDITSKIDFYKTTTVSNPQNYFNLRSVHSYKKSFSFGLLNKHSLANFVKHVGIRVCLAQLLYSYDFVEVAKLRALLNFVQKQQIQQKQQKQHKQEKSEPTKQNNSATKPLPSECGAKSKCSYANFDETFWIIPKKFLCNYCSMGTVLRLGCLNRDWFKQIMNAQFLHVIKSMTKFKIDSQLLEKYEKWFSSTWLLSGVQEIEIDTDYEDIFNSEFPFIDFINIQLFKGNILHVDKFNNLLKILHVCNQKNHSSACLAAYETLQSEQHLLDFLIISDDDNRQVPQYPYTQKLLYSRCVVECEHLVAALKNSTVQWVGLQDCHTDFGYFLFDGALNGTQYTAPEKQQQTTFVSIDSGDWFIYELIFKVAHVYEDYISNVFVKNNYNLVNRTMHGFLDTLIDVNNCDIPKSIVLMFEYDGTIYIPNEKEEPNHGGPEEVIFSWCLRNREAVWYNTQIKSMIFMIVVDEAQNKTQCFDLKQKFDKKELTKEYFLWGRCVYQQEYENRISPNIWKQVWSKMIQQCVN